jgi:hypothetical protein
MKISELLSESYQKNPNERYLKDTFRWEGTVGKYWYTMTGHTISPMDQDTPGMTVSAYTDKSKKTKIAQTQMVTYNGEDEYIQGGDTWVDKKYQRQGIATAMYSLVNSLGFRIEPTPSGQTDQGTKMWTAWQNTGITDKFRTQHHDDIESKRNEHGM